MSWRANTPKLTEPRDEDLHPKQQHTNTTNRDGNLAPWKGLSGFFIPPPSMFHFSVLQAFRDTRKKGGSRYPEFERDLEKDCPGWAGLQLKPVPLAAHDRHG